MPSRSSAPEHRPVYTCASPERLPSHPRVLFEAAGRHFAREGYRLRCAGGAGGASAALRSGLQAPEDVDVLVPWAGYGSGQPAGPAQTSPDQARLYRGEADALARALCPRWPDLRESVRRVEAARTARVAGGLGHPPARFVLCWTPGGATRPEEIREWTGRASQIIRVAASQGIPVLNVKLGAGRKRIEAMLGEDLPAGTSSPQKSPCLRQAEAREAFADMHAQAEARRKAAEKRREECKIEQTPIPEKVSAKKTETAKRKEKESRGQGSLFG